MKLDVANAQQIADQTIHVVDVQDNVEDALKDVQVAIIVVLAVKELVMEDAKELALPLALNNAQDLVQLDALDIAIMDVQVKK